MLVYCLVVQATTNTDFMYSQIMSSNASIVSVREQSRVHRGYLVLSLQRGTVQCDIRVNDECMRLINISYCQEVDFLDETIALPPDTKGKA